MAEHPFAAGKGWPAECAGLVAAKNAELAGLYVKLGKLREACAATRVCGSPAPVDCNGSCDHGECTCSGKFRPVAWSLDPASVLAILDGKP